MANLRLGAALGAVAVTFLVFLQLIAVMQHADQVPVSSFNKNLNHWRNRAGAATDDGLFLVGAGKADVTGYSSISIIYILCGSFSNLAI
jgi:neutral ceramidase